MFIKDLLKHKKSNERCKVVKAVTLAMGVGVSLGVLIAPKPGKDTREDILNELEKVANTLKSAAAEIKESIINKEEQMQDNIKNTAEEVKDNLNKTIDDAATYAEEAKKS